MEKYTLQLVAPTALYGLKSEIEKLKEYEGDPVFLQVAGMHCDMESFSEWIARGEAADFVLIFEQVTESKVSREKARDELLETVKQLCFQPTKLIFILSESQKADLMPFVNELIKLNLQNFYFVQEFRVGELTEWLFREKTLKDNLSYIQKTERPKEKIVEKEVIRYVTTPAENDQVDLAQSFSRKPQPQVHPVTKITGVFGSCRGIGCTTLCVQLAQLYAQDNNIAVAILVKEENHGLQDVQLNHIDVYTGVPLASVDLRRYDRVFIDFGIYAGIDPGGKYIKEKVDLHRQQAVELELQFCNSVVMVASAEPWRQAESLFYIDGVALRELSKDWIFYMRHTTAQKQWIQKHSRKRLLLSALTDGLERLKEELSHV